MTKFAALTAVVAASMILATTTRQAEACGSYSPEAALEWRVSLMFVGHESTDAELAKRYPKLAPGDIGALRISSRAFARSRWLLIDGDEAQALVEIVEKIRGVERSRFVEMSFVNPTDEARGWQPASIRPASAERVAALEMAEKVSAAASRLAASVSSRLAKR